MLRYLSGEAVQAHPPSAGYRLRKFVRRNRGQVIAASLVITALLAGIAGTTLGMIQARKSAAAERKAKDDAEIRRDEAERLRVRAEAGEKLAGVRLLQVEGETKRAEKEKRIAQAAQEFLQNKLLGQADVETQADSLLASGHSIGQAKQNPTIRELLDRAAEELTEAKMEANFPQQPELQVAILETVGNTYRGVGEYERAIEFLDRALTLQKQHFGPKHDNTLTAMNNLASAYLLAGKPDSAVSLFEETLRLRRATLVAKDPATLRSMNNLGMAYVDAGRFGQAITLLEETLKLNKAKYGAEAPETLTSMNNLAVAYQGAGSWIWQFLFLRKPLSHGRQDRGLITPPHSPQWATSPGPTWMPRMWTRQFRSLRKP